MIKAPFGFFEMVQEVIDANTAQLCQAELGKAPKGLDAIDVSAAPGEFIGMVMNAVVLVSIENEPIVSLPAVGVDRAFAGDDLLSNHFHQLCRGTVGDRHREDLAFSFEQPNHRNLPSGSSTSHPSNPPRSEVAFIDLHAARKRRRLSLRQFHDSPPDQSVNSMRRVLIHSRQLACRQRSHVCTPALHSFNISRNLSSEMCAPLKYLFFTAYHHVIQIGTG